MRRLLAITPAAAAGAIDPARVRAWVAGGLAGELAVLLREPGAGPQVTLSERLDPLREALAEASIPALVSLTGEHLASAPVRAALRQARPALAGVQLRGDPGADALARAREQLPGGIVGCSCHGSVPPVEAPGADYCCLAPVFAPRSAQPGVDKRALGLDALRRWAAVVPRIWALGGVTPRNAGSCLEAGAAGVAGISMFFGPIGSVEDNARELRELLARAEPD